jgi:hypothetical protein
VQVKTPTRPGDLDVTSNVTINGVSAAATTIDGGAIDRVLHVVSGTLTLNSVTVTNGMPPAADLADLGGGIYLSDSGSVLLLSNSMVNGNQGWTGGGISSWGSVTVDSSTISGNIGDGEGGGGIAALIGSALTVTNSTISGNSADAQGGGIIVGSSAVATIINSTITENYSGFVGGILQAGAVELKNSILAGNSSATGPDCKGTIASQGHNLIQDISDCTISGDTTGNVIGSSPLLGPLQGNGGPTFTHALLSGSPAIDAGDDSAAPATDQRGIVRPQGSASDIGAFEVEVVAATPTPTPTSVPGVSGMGLLAMAGLLVAASLWTHRRRSRALAGR